jgi:hypothetical protein
MGGRPFKRAWPRIRAATAPCRIAPEHNAPHAADECVSGTSVFVHSQAKLCP